MIDNLLSCELYHCGSHVVRYECLLVTSCATVNEINILDLLITDEREVLYVASVLSGDSYLRKIDHLPLAYARMEANYPEGETVGNSQRDQTSAASPWPVGRYFCMRLVSNGSLAGVGGGGGGRNTDAFGPQDIDRWIIWREGRISSITNTVDLR